MSLLKKYHSRLFTRLNIYHHISSSIAHIVIPCFKPISLLCLIFALQSKFFLKCKYDSVKLYNRANFTREILKFETVTNNRKQLSKILFIFN